MKMQEGLGEIVAVAEKIFDSQNKGQSGKRKSMLCKKGHCSFIII